MRYYFHALTSSGQYLDRNEDRVIVDGNLIKNGELAGVINDRLLAVICDGVGGCEFGEKAASTAAISLLSACASKQDPFTLCAALLKANEDIKSEQRRDARCSDMKTTVAALYLDDSGYLVLNAGDTRVYQLCDEGIVQLSEDHTLLAETESDNETHDRYDQYEELENTITRYMGAEEGRFRPAVAGNIHASRADTTYLVCSDGAYRGVPSKRIEDVLRLPASLAERARILFRLAEESGTTDNISLVLIQAQMIEPKQD